MLSNQFFFQCDDSQTYRPHLQQQMLVGMVGLLLEVGMVSLMLEVGTEGLLLEVGMVGLLLEVGIV